MLLYMLVVNFVYDFVVVVREVYKNKLVYYILITKHAFDEHYGLLVPSLLCVLRKEHDKILCKCCY